MSNPSRNPQWEAVATTAAATILTSVSGRATKIHTATPGGGWATQGYDRLHTFSAAPFEASDLREFMASLVEASQHPQALLVAEVPHPASNWRRLPRRIHGADPGLVRSLVGTQWVCWEVDGVAGEVPADVDPRAHADRDGDFVRWWMGAHLPPQFAQASAVLQWSASAFVGGKLSMHIWQWLDRPVSRESIHAYMEDHKHDDPPHWRRFVDTTIWDGARVHYIADPVFVEADGTKRADMLAGRRWQWVQGEGGDEATALTEWEDEAAWLERLGREAAAMEATKLQAAEERAKRSSAEAGRRARGERPQEAAGDETGALLEVSCLGCRLEDLDPKRVLAWAQKAIRSGVAKINGAVAGDVVEGRHPAIREAGFVAGNILAGLDELDAALAPAVKSRVDWYGGVTAAERAVDELEAAAVAVGGVDRARVLTWAVRIGRGVAVLPDYRTPEQYRQGAGGGKVVSMKTKKVLPAYEGQPGLEVEVDEETGEVVEGKRGGGTGAAREWTYQPCDSDLGLAVIEDLEAESGSGCVFDEGQLWQYAAKEGVYQPITTAQLTQRLMRWHGAMIWAEGDDEPKPVKITAAKAKGAQWITEQLRATPGFFKGAPRGFVTADRVMVSANTRTGEIGQAPADEHARARATLAVRFNPEAQGKLLNHYLSTVHAGQPDEAERLQLMGEVGFVALMGLGPWLNKAIMAYGEGGTGKSVWLQIVAALVPEDARCHLQPHQISHEYYGAKLAGKTLNMVTECRASVMSEESDFKAVISGEPVTRRHIEGSPFDFRPIALHLFAANRLPPSPGATDAYWTRWLPIGFERKKRDTDGEIKELAELIIETEMEAVLAWVMKCGEALLKRRKYTIPASSAAIVGEWRVGSDSVAAWVEEMANKLLPDAARSKWVSSTLAYSSYKMWARDGGFKEVNKVNFKDRLIALGVSAVKTSGVVKFSLALRGDSAEADGEAPWL